MRPTLEPWRRDALAEIDVVTRAKPGSRCMAIVSGGMSWVPTSPVYCKKKATVHVGFNACTEHGAKAEADRLHHEIYRETRQWLGRAV